MDKWRLIDRLVYIILISGFVYAMFLFATLGETHPNYEMNEYGQVMEWFPPSPEHGQEYTAWLKWSSSFGPGEKKLVQAFDFWNCVNGTSYIDDDKAWDLVKSKTKYQSEMLTIKNQKFVDDLNKCIKEFQK